MTIRCVFQVLLVAVVLYAGGWVGGVEAQAPEPLKTPQRLISSAGGDCRELEVFDGRLFMALHDLEHGGELWVSDGTAEGTRLFQDLNAGPGSSRPRGLKAGEGALYFSAVQEGFGRELWRLAAGDSRGVQVADIWPGPGSSMPDAFTFWKGVLFLMADDGVSARELWRTNGTDLGTVLATHLRPGAFAVSGETLMPGEESLLVSHWVDSGGPPRMEVWRLDDPLGVAYRIAHLTGMDMVRRGRDGRLFFAMADSAVYGQELWTLDVGRSHASALTNVSVAGQSVQFAGLKFWRGAWYVWMTTTPTQAGEARVGLWRVDGSLRPVLIAELWKGELYNLSANPQWAQRDEALVQHDNVLWFSGPATAESGAMLWRTDGTPAGTKSVASLGSVFSWQEPFVVGGAVCAWTTDPLNGALNALRCVDQATSEARTLPLFPQGQVVELADQVVWNEQLYVCARIGGDAGLWRVDVSSAAGETTFLQKLSPAIPSAAINPSFTMTRLGERVLFGANDGSTGETLWLSDGTHGGTQPIPHAVGKDSTVYGHGVSLGAKAIFSALTPEQSVEPWITDGTAAGTKLLKDIAPKTEGSYPSEYCAVGERVIFSAENAKNGRELWISDTTPAGTKLLKDIDPGQNAYPTYLFFWPAKKLVFFSAYNPAHGRELWVTDGTPGGTKLLKDLVQSDGSSDPSQFVLVGDRVMFTAYSYDQGQELWTSDGTAAGTYLVADIYPGYDSSSPSLLTPLGNKVVFSATSPTHGSEPWISDGTAAGTTPLKDIGPGAGSSYPLCIFPFRGQIVFSALDPTLGYRLWITDGTSAGTTYFAGLPARTVSACPIASHNDLLYLNATTIEHGSELWVTDGTTAGTRIVLDQCPGPCYSYFDVLKTALGLFVMFRSDDPPISSELWLIAPP